jgi:TM2 domain-containing membrane protein YozV
MVLAALVYALVVIMFMRRRGGLAYTAATWGWAVLGALQVALAFIIANSGVSLLAGGICLAVSLAISWAAYPFIRHAKA